MAILQQIAFIVESYRFKNHLMYTNNSSTFEYLYLCLSNAWYQNKYNYINSCFLNYFLYVTLCMHDFILQKSFDLLLQLNHTIPADILATIVGHTYIFNAHKQYEKNKDSL